MSLGKALFDVIDDEEDVVPLPIVIIALLPLIVVAGLIYIPSLWFKVIKRCTAQNKKSE